MIELDWYCEYWINIIYIIDYGIENVKVDGCIVVVVLNWVGIMFMFVEVEVVFIDGMSKWIFVLLCIMCGYKLLNDMELVEDWLWMYFQYELDLGVKVKDIEKVVIDFDFGMADIDWENNIYEMISDE